MLEKSKAYINPKILKWAREQCGFSYEEAVQSYFNPEKLEKAELGDELLTFKQLLYIANKYKRSPAFFYLKKPPDEDLIKDFRKVYSKKAKFSPLLRDQIINIKEKRAIAVEFKKYDKEYDYSYIKSITLNNNPEIVAQQIINLLKLDIKSCKKWKDEYKAFSKWKDLFEEIGILVFQISRIDIKEMRGFSISEIPFPTVALNRSDSPLGRIFTLIHELCHLMLNRGGICTLKSENEYHFEIEKFCNAVAGAVLVPKNILKEIAIVNNSQIDKEWQIEELNYLKKIFWASNEVILRRLLIIHKTSDEYYSKMRDYWINLPSSSRGGPEKPFEKIFRTNPKIFLKIIINAKYNHDITMTDVSNYLDMSLKYFRNLEKSLK